MIYTVVILPVANCLSLRLGLGAPLPKDTQDGSSNRKKLSSNDKLRKQLLGRDMQKLGQKASTISRNGPAVSKSVSQPHKNAKQIVDTAESEDEEEGRSSLGKRKKKSEAYMDMAAEEGEENADGSDGGRKKATKRSVSGQKSGGYLDEVLSARSRSRKKKSKVPQ